MIAFLAFVVVAQADAPKYIFLFIGDGMSAAQRMVAEEFVNKTNGEPLVMNKFPYQVMTRTRAADSILTDSAAAATAIACGVKANCLSLGVNPKNERVESVAEIAKRKGRKVGILTNVTIVHATPAGFYAHIRDRSDSYAIALDLVNSGFDFFAGGGMYGKENDTKHKLYKGNIFELAQKKGYTLIRDSEGMKSLKPGGKVWCAFGDKAMPYAIDEDYSMYPGLDEMLAKGIELLDNPNGFFIMCEGGLIDYCSHANDAAAAIRETVVLDNAVRVALKFQEKHPDDTLIIVTGDHETGGMAMGYVGAGGRFNVKLLKDQKIAVGTFSEMVKKMIAAKKLEITFEEVEPLVVEKFGLKKLNDKERSALKEAFNADIDMVKRNIKDTKAHNVRRVYLFAQAVKNVLNSRAGIGWSSFSHTALPTLTTAKGPGADILFGIVENSDLGTRLKQLVAGEWEK